MSDGTFPIQCERCHALDVGEMRFDRPEPRHPRRVIPWVKPPPGWFVRGAGKNAVDYRCARCAPVEKV